MTNRKPFTPYFRTAGRDNNLISSAAITSGVTYFSVIAAYGRFILDRADPGCHSKVLKDRSSLDPQAMQKALIEVATRMSGCVPGRAEDNDTTFRFLTDIPLVDFSDSRRLARMATGLENLMVTVAWPGDLAVDIAVVVAQLTDAAVFRGRLSGQ